MQLKGPHFADVAVIQEAVTDEIKKVQKEEFSAAFRNCTAIQKPAYMPMELILNKERYVFSSCVFDLKKNQS
jgi:hypothetical protein